MGPRTLMVPRRLSHRRSTADKIEDLGGTVIDTSNVKSMVKSTVSRVRQVDLFSAIS